MSKEKPFSVELKTWVKSSSKNTAENLELVFGERSFSIIFLVFMALPALPIPTGGITHVLEVACMILAIELIIGFKGVWLPKNIRSKELPKSITNKMLPSLIKRIEWFEKRSKRRGVKILRNRWFLRFAGVCILASTLSAFLAPPFSGLDTIPAFGVVVMALGMTIDDLAFFIVGAFIGLVGIVLELTVGAAVLSAAKKFILHAPLNQKLIALGIGLILVLVFVVRHRMKKNKND